MERENKNIFRKYDISENKNGCRLKSFLVLIIVSGHRHPMGAWNTPIGGYAGMGANAIRPYGQKHYWPKR